MVLHEQVWPQEVVMNSDQLKGKVEALKGKAEKVVGRVKEAIGSATGNKRAEAEGVVDRAKGEVRETVGQAKQDIASSEAEEVDDRARQAAGEEDPTEKT
jgi:uncharacterized protein YjbJ (UPF0337 family)